MLRVKNLSPWSKTVKKTMIDQEMTNIELADKVGKRPQYVSAVINGYNVGGPRVKETIDKISFVLGIEPGSNVPRC